MKLSDLKHLVNLLESRGINDDYNLKFTCNMTPNDWHNIEDMVLDETDIDSQRFDIGHSDKSVSIYTTLKFD